MIENNLLLVIYFINLACVGYIYFDTIEITHENEQIMRQRFRTDKSFKTSR